MVREKEKYYYKTRFIKLDDMSYIRQIKPRRWSSWKLVTNKKNGQLIIFSKYEVSNFHAYKTFETAYIGDGSLCWKYDDYDLI